LNDGDSSPTHSLRTENSVTRSKKRILIILQELVLAAVDLSGCGGVDAEGNYKPGIFEPLAAPLRALIVFFHDRLLVPMFGEANMWGWSIILVALLIRLLLLPLGLKQMKSMKEAQAKMKVLQPELDRIKKKYAHDKKKQQEEQMKLQQEAGIMKAQMAGCLPTLLQMPILFAFYYALIGLAAQGRIDNAAWYFIPDISKPEYRQGMSWLTQDFTLQKLLQPDIWPYLVLPALLAVTQFAMTRYSQQAQPKTGDSNPASGMMGSMTWIMTLMFVWFALQVPAGLSLYWVVSNAFALAQQLYVNRQAKRWEEQLELGGLQESMSKKSSGDAEDAEYKDAPPKKPASSPTQQTKRKRRRKR
jgi:YidC/Oxa1 family membrane protein insertase